jgi:glycosyltransferase involved in cell wall biosynthesis
LPAKLQIGIIGTRGIPNRYGGFEAFAGQLSVRLVDRGHRVRVFCSHDQEYQKPAYQGVELALTFNPEKWLGTFGQFIYDLNCNRKTRGDSFDVVLHLGYTSDSVWHWLWPDGPAHVTNMDGMEWQRAKYADPVKKFLRSAEIWAAENSHLLVADSTAVQQYLETRYKTPVRYIAYGATVPEQFNLPTLKQFNLAPGKYDLVIARLEPENNIDLAIRAKLKSGNSIPLVIIGNETAYGKKLLAEYKNHPLICFMKPCYDEEKLNTIRHYARFYIHGHSAGGTNPSLLEAMACGCRILSHDNPFNRAVLQEDARYFRDAEELDHLLNIAENDPGFERFTKSNLEKIRKNYSWDFITSEYERLFYEAVELARH